VGSTMHTARKRTRMQTHSHAKRTRSWGPSSRNYPQSSHSTHPDFTIFSYLGASTFSIAAISLFTSSTAQHPCQLAARVNPRTEHKAQTHRCCNVPY
jgi:hypothetical protein